MKEKNVTNMDEELRNLKNKYEKEIFQFKSLIENNNGKYNHLIEKIHCYTKNLKKKQKEFKLNENEISDLQLEIEYRKRENLKLQQACSDLKQEIVQVMNAPSLRQTNIKTE